GRFVARARPVGPQRLAEAAAWRPRLGHRAGDGPGRATQPGLFVPLADDEECQSGTAKGAMAQSDWSEARQGWQGKQTRLRLEGWSWQRRVILLRFQLK